MGSNAVSQQNVSAVIGYLLAKGYFNPKSPFLPQSISIFGEANTTNQASLTTTPFQITSAQQAAQACGYGSPVHQIARILFPVGGGGAVVPVYVYPQLAAVGSVAKVITITPTGTATGSGTIYLNICGREFVDGGSYAINVAIGDTPTNICDKMRTAIANVLGCPVTGSGTSTCIATAKWTGLTSNDINISIDLNGTNLGVTFAVANTTAGSGTPNIANSLNLIGNSWKTIIINSYGFVSQTITELESFNGVADPLNPTGRFTGTIWKPIFALTGTTLDDPTNLTGASGRQSQMTIYTCPAPQSPGMPFEAAANMALLFSNIAQNSPHLDVLGLSYPDMPVPAAGVVPSMCDYNFRQKCVTNGCSTVDLVSGAYQVQDFISTYNPTGEYPPFYRWARDMNIHFNVKFRLLLLMQQQQQGKTVVKDSDVVTAANVIKPKQWKAEVGKMVDGLVSDALLTDAAFSKESIDVSINSGNPNRLDTTLNTKITGLARICAVTDTSGFNFSN